MPDLKETLLNCMTKWHGNVTLEENIIFASYKIKHKYATNNHVFLFIFRQASLWQPNTTVCSLVLDELIKVKMSSHTAYIYIHIYIHIHTYQLCILIDTIYSALSTHFLKSLFIHFVLHFIINLICLGCAPVYFIVFIVSV